MKRIATLFCILCFLLPDLMAQKSVSASGSASAEKSATATASVNGKETTTVNAGYEILTPKPGPKPRINGPLVYGARPGNPFLYRIPCQGDRPIRFRVDGLPESLKLDPETGIISGTTPPNGEYQLVIRAANNKGKDTRNLKIISGDKLALTPPMGWNHWYAHYYRITDLMMREAANILISSGMADVGYEYVNIDDCWMNADPKTIKNDDPSRHGPFRDEKGNILSNRHFPDMKGLTDYIHAKGLKAGIYTSPGELTCQGFSGSYQHEAQDAKLFADWGFDFLKYDWCSYRKIVAGDNSLETLQKPYRQMGDILNGLNRDIVFNLCQYGMGNVWEWGEEVGGHCWRTAGDLGFSLDKVFDVALKNIQYREHSKPGAWNDPDYIQIGWIGKARQQSVPELTKMPPAMQYSYMSLWSLMASPLFYSGDMSRLDPFTLNILCNPEVIDVNQDPLGECGELIEQSKETFLVVKNLHDGSKAIGFFNRGAEETEMTVQWKDMGLSGKLSLFDLWRHKKLGTSKEKFTVKVPSQGVAFIKVSSRK